MTEFGDINETVVEAVGAKLFPQVDMMLRQGFHLSPDGAFDEFRFVDTHREGLYLWYRRYGYSLIYNDNRYAYIEPQGADAPSRPLSVFEMIAGQALYVQYLDPAGLQSDGTYMISDFHNNIQRILGDDGLEKLVSGKRKLPKERVITKARDEFSKALRVLKKLGFIASAGDKEFCHINKSIGRFGEMVSGLETDPEVAIEEMIRQGKIMWVLDESIAEISDNGEKTVGEGEAYEK